MTHEAAYIGLGSNLHDRVEAITTALEKLQALERCKVTDVSSLYETSPVEVLGGTFLNAVARIETGLGPRVLLKTLLDIETAMGRNRDRNGGEPRIIDLDLLLYKNTIIKEHDLVLPHPRMLNRRFVMEPLAELAPDLKIPPSWTTASEAAAELAKSHPEQEIKRLGTLREVEEDSAAKASDLTTGQPSD